MISFDYFANLAPQKYYDNKDKTPSAIAKREAMLSNKDYEYVATPKFDGEWCMLIKAEGKILARSRSISKVTGTYGDYTQKIPHIIDQFDQFFPNGTVLIGELCFAEVDKTSKDVGSVLRCLPPKAIERQKNNPLFFFFFDMLAFDGISYINATYKDRFVKFADFYDSDFGLNGAFVTEPFYVDSVRREFNDFSSFVEGIWAIGGEGIVIQRLDSIYAPGSRPSWQSLKIKKQLGEIEVPILGLVPATYLYEGDCPDSWQYKNDKGENITKFAYYGWPGAITVDYKGKMVSVASGLTDEDRAWLAESFDAENPLYAVITAMEETADGSLRHPVLVRIRTDL